LWLFLPKGSGELVGEGFGEIGYGHLFLGLDEHLDRHAGHKAARPEGREVANGPGFGAIKASPVWGSRVAAAARRVMTP
jgi:hypothetical protein